jgi:hypothetical protein
MGSKSRILSLYWGQNDSTVTYTGFADTTCVSACVSFHSHPSVFAQSQTTPLVIADWFICVVKQPMAWAAVNQLLTVKFLLHPRLDHMAQNVPQGMCLRYTGLLKLIAGVLTSFSKCNPMWFLSVGLRQESGLCFSSSRKCHGTEGTN